MARINVEDSLWSDLRFLKLCIALGDEIKAVGSVVVAWKTAQRFWCPAKNPIPEIDFLRAGLPEDLIAVGLAERTPSGVRIMGSEEHFAWWFDRQEGGRKSAQMRKKKYGSSQPSNPRTRVRETPELPRTGLEHSSTISRTSSSSSFLRAQREVPCLLSEKKTRTPRSARGGTEEKTKNDAIASEMPATAVTPSRKPPSLPTEGINQLIAVYVESWQKRYETKARPEISKCIGVFRALLQERGSGELSELVQVYCQMQDKWFLTKHHDIVTFKENIGKVAVARDKGSERPNGEKHWTELAKERGL